MAANALMPDTSENLHRDRAKRAPRWIAPAALAAIVIGMVLLFVLRAPTIETRDREPRIINVVLPPPPSPPPPPPPKERPPEPDKPKLVEPQPTPQTPPPPTPTPPTADANDALSAREGPAAGNFGLAAGNGGGTRIGGGTGSGNGFGAYGAMIVGEIERAVRNDPKLGRGRYSARLSVDVSPDGVITAVRIADGSDDDERDEQLRTRLVGLRLPQRPPAGLPAVRVELNARPSL